MNATIAGKSIPLYQKADRSLQLACTVSADERGNSVGSTSRTKASLADMHTRSGSKKVDYVLVLDLLEEDPLRKIISKLIDWLTDTTDTTASINQAFYEPLLQRLTTVSIEMKPSYVASPNSDALIQVGRWTAAWHKHMYALQRDYKLIQVKGDEPHGDDALDTQQKIAPEQNKPVSPAPLVSLPLLQVVGHFWTSTLPVTWSIPSPSTVP